MLLLEEAEAERQTERETERYQVGSTHAG